MKPTAMALAVWSAYGQQRIGIASAAWMWFRWERNKYGQMDYRWVL